MRPASLVELMIRGQQLLALFLLLFPSLPSSFYVIVLHVDLCVTVAELRAETCRKRVELECACVLDTYEALDLDRVLSGTEVGHLQRLHVENVDTLELSEKLESLKTGSLLLVGGHLTILGTLTLNNGRTGSESECGRGEESRGRVDRGGGHAESGGCAGNETTSGEEHVEETIDQQL